MSDLVEFLRARVDEDEAVARNADGTLQNLTSWIEVEYPETRADEAHALRHAPPRVLREVEAKRRIIDETWGGPDHEDVWLHHIRLLALAYADHPDYSEEWRP